MSALSRRSFVAAGAGLAALYVAHGVRAAASGGPTTDAWFWDVIRQLEAGPPVGGPSAGTIDHSVFGVDAHRAGRVNPAGPAPLLADFYLHAVLEPDPTDGSAWDVGFVWRISSAMDALWWTVTSDGQWSLQSAKWEYSPRDAADVLTGELCTGITTPVRLQALAFGSQLACAVNQGAVIGVGLPERREAGQVGILANAQEEHLRPNGSTRYRELAVWSLESADLSGAPAKIRRTRC